MKGSVLIVEDSHLVAVHLQTLLEKNDFEVVGHAVSSEEAIKIFEKKVPDLILMDIMLAGTDDGIETVQELRKKSNVPVIYLTALTDQSTIERAKATAPHGYIMKPFIEEQVITLIDMAIHRAQVEKELYQSNSKFKTTVSSISDAIIVLNQDFTIEYINKAAVELSGWTLGEIEGENFHEIFRFRDIETDEELRNPFHKMNGKKGEEFVDAHLVRKDDNTVAVGDGTINPILGKEKKMDGIVITLRNITERLRQREIDLQNEKNKMTSVIEGQEMERARIARELHDGLGQMLNGIKLGLSAVSKKIGQQDLQNRSTEILNDINEAINETRRISENLLPAKLKDFDLSTCLLSLATKNQAEVDISFESTDINERKIGMNKRINLYRITQEAINNSIKHAQARKINIQLRGYRDYITLTIEDEGKGFDIRKHKNKVLNGHNGLYNMIDRVNVMNGDIDIDSSEELGTMISVKVPYDKN